MGHSKLPWKTEGMHAYGWDIYSGDLWIGTIHNSHHQSNNFPSDSEGKANANLIAAVNVMPEVMSILRTIAEEQIRNPLRMEVLELRAVRLLERLEGVDG